MAFNPRNAVPLDFASDPTLPQADSSQPHDIPTGVSPTTAKLQDWIAALAGSVVVLPDIAAATIDVELFNVVPNVSQSTTYTIPDPAADGLRMWVSRTTVGSTFVAEFLREDTTSVVTLPDSGESWAMLLSVSGAWQVFAWGGDALFGA